MKTNHLENQVNRIAFYILQWVMTRGTYFEKNYFSEECSQTRLQSRCGPGLVLSSICASGEESVSKLRRLLAAFSSLQVIGLRASVSCWLSAGGRLRSFQFLARGWLPIQFLASGPPQHDLLGSYNLAWSNLLLTDKPLVRNKPQALPTLKWGN